jgi:hypothetical protein
MIRVSHRTPAEKDARKVRQILADGFSVTLAGDERQLRKIAQSLAEDPCEVFLGDAEDADGPVPMLIVSPPDGAGGALVYERR